VQYLNNVLEQDHRAIKRRVRASQHFRSFWGAWRTIAGYEAGDRSMSETYEDPLNQMILAKSGLKDDLLDDLSKHEKGMALDGAC
jgi:hypothetical protein